MEDTYATLAARGAEMADLSADAGDVLYWSRYAASMALLASKEHEDASPVSQAWRVRRMVAFSGAGS